MKRFTKRITNPVRLSLLIIAFSLAINTGILSLSAYLTDKETRNDNFTIASGEEFGLAITMEAYDPEANVVIYPGDTLPYDPTITCGTVSCYVFIDLKQDGDIVPAIDPDWTLLDGTLYYYSPDGNKAPLPQSGSTFIHSILFPATAEMSDTFNISLTAYAVQTAHNESLTVQQLARLAGAIE